MLLGLTQQQKVLDWWKLRQYQPPVAISEIASQTTMTPAAVHLFYINQPSLDDKATFRRNCPDYEQTIVLGCYKSVQHGIHVLQVDEPRLEGVEQVTAAHEMLHAAYDRLGKTDRQRIDGLLQDFARRQLDNDRIKATLKGYERTEPGAQNTEMHAIFGTEVAVLPGELEEYYRQYFSDRQVVVRFAANYQEAFTSRQNQIKDYDRQLTTLKSHITSRTGELERRRDALSVQERQLEGYRRQGDIVAYNAAVNDYNQAVAAFNQILEQTKSLIARHNQLVEKRNQLAVQTVELQQAIDSSALPENQ